MSIGDVNHSLHMKASLRFVDYYITSTHKNSDTF